ncbi:hypothetical protein ACHQM5_021930 [Ranunculus cassubicifolius]
METNSKAHFVLVHGIGAGGWCWYKIRSLLEKSGYKVSCPDLKSAGIDPTDPDSLNTFDDYNQPLHHLLSTIPANEKVVLVGHSAGGLSVTDAIHKFGKKIDVAIYVCATMLRQGFFAEEDIKDGVPDLSEYGDIYEPSTNSIMKREFQRKLIYQMCPEEDATLSWMLSKVGPFRAITSAKYPENSGVDEVKRVYVKTMHDRVLKVAQQDAMIKKWPPSDVFVIESDHSPIFSTPSDLFKLLVKSAGLD